MGARLDSLAWASALFVASPPAPAQTAAYRLELVRAEGTGSCPTARELERDVAQRLGRDPFSEAAERSIEVVLERDSSKWRARLYLRVDDSNEDAARVIESDASECAGLGKSVALAVALALAPDLPPAPPPAPPPKNVSAPPPPPPAPPARGTWHGAVALRASVSPNLLPRSAVGAALSVTLRGDLLGANAGALFYPERRFETGEGSFGFGLSAGFLSGCLWPREREPQLWSCLGAQVGALHTVVYAPLPATPGDRPWLAASSELGVRQSLFGRLFVEGGAAALFPFVRHRFAVGAEDGGERRIAYEQQGVIVEGFVGLGLRLD